MTGAPDHRLEWFGRWRDAEASELAAFRAAAWILVGRPDAARVLAAQPKVPLLQALTATDAAAAERGFAEALADGADWSVFELRVPEPPIAARRPAAGKAEEAALATFPGRAALRRAILQRLGSHDGPTDLVPALRALALWGEDMPALLADPAFAKLTKEPWPSYEAGVCGGVR
jgi:hypothetical protein